MSAYYLPVDLADIPLPFAVFRSDGMTAPLQLVAMFKTDDDRERYIEQYKSGTA